MTGALLPARPTADVGGVEPGLKGDSACCGHLDTAAAAALPPPAAALAVRGEVGKAAPAAVRVAAAACVHDVDASLPR